MAEMAARGDAYGLAAADTAFHRALCMLGGNSVIVDLWETLAQQLTIIFGLATTGKTMPSVVDEHRELFAALLTGRKRRIAEALHTHIAVMNVSVDYEAIVEARRAARRAEVA
jgi:DNA-binding GntR family transcriptional regulator